MFSFPHHMGIDGASYSLATGAERMSVSNTIWTLLLEFPLAFSKTCPTLRAPIGKEAPITMIYKDICKYITIILRLGAIGINCKTSQLRTKYIPINALKIFVHIKVRLLTVIESFNANSIHRVEIVKQTIIKNPTAKEKLIGVQMSLTAASTSTFKTVSSCTIGKRKNWR